MDPFQRPTTMLRHLPTLTLREDLLLWQQITGLTASLFTPEGALICASAPLLLCDICKDYSPQFSADKSCWKTLVSQQDRQICHGAAKPVLHRCRRGGSSLCLPLMWEKEWIGTLIFGYFHLQDDASPRRANEDNPLVTPEQLNRLELQIQAAGRNLLNLLSNEAPTTSLLYRVLSNLNHELRTPLVGLIGLSDALTQEGSPLTQDALQMVQLIKEAGIALNDIFQTVSDNLEVHTAAAPAGQNDCLFNLGDLLQTQVNLFQPLARQKGLEFMVSADPEVRKLELKGNKNGIMMILSHLLSNAFKFTPKGHVALELRQVSVGHQKVELMLSVADSGVGISDEVQTKIFTPFFRTSFSNDNRTKGLGLGLTAIKKLVCRMQGSMGFESYEQVGSRFWCLLSLELQQPLAQEQTPGRNALDAQYQPKLDEGAYAC